MISELKHSAWNYLFEEEKEWRKSMRNGGITWKELTYAQQELRKEKHKRDQEGWLKEIMDKKILP
jgi:hypothetical protein